MQQVGSYTPSYQLVPVSAATAVRSLQVISNSPSDGPAKLLSVVSVSAPAILMSPMLLAQAKLVETHQPPISERASGSTMVERASLRRHQRQIPDGPIRLSAISTRTIVFFTFMGMITASRSRLAALELGRYKPSMPAMVGMWLSKTIISSLY